MGNKRGLLIALVLCAALLAAFFCASTVVADEPPDDGPVTVRRWVTDPDGPTEAEIRALRQQLRQATPAEAAVILADYARTQGLDTARVPPRPPARRDQPRDLSLQLGGQALLPTSGLEPAVSELAHTLTQAQVGAADYQAALARLPTKHIPCIVQFNRELSIDERIILYNLGLKLEEPASDYAVLSLVPAESMATLAELPFVRWVGEYRPDFKVQASKDWSNEAWVFAIGRAQPGYADSLRALGLSAEYDAVMDAYWIDQPAGRVADVAALWWVRQVEAIPSTVDLGAPEANLDFWASDSREMIDAPYVWPTYTGLNVTVGLCERGLWTGNTADFPPGAIDPSSDAAADETAHGTHVAGIIAARGGYDIEGPHDAKGVAPEAIIFFKERYDPLGDSLSNSFTAWANAGVRISNHSWGVADDNFDYSSTTETFDERCDEYDEIPIISAGNSGSSHGPQSITNPGTSKNAIVVGGVEYVPGPYAEVGTRTSTSSYGPTRNDGRLKPDIVAPGGHPDEHMGVVSTNAKVGSDWVITDSTTWQPITYTRMTGTSQAAPHVAGTAALMLQSDSDMTSELFKAWLIATTIPLGEDGGSDPRNGYASCEVGYGLVNAYNAAGRAYGGESDYLLIMEGTVTEDVDEQDESFFYVPASTQRLIVTLAYDDEKGCGSYGAPGCLIDDLDLRLTAPGGAVYTYILPECADNENPLEKIIVENPASG